MMKQSFYFVFFLSALLSFFTACSDSNEDGNDEPQLDGDQEEDGDTGLDGDEEDDEPSDGDEDGDTEDGEEEEQAPEMPVAACGMPNYELIPTDELGQIVDWKNDPFYDLDPDTIDGLLNNEGYDALSPVPYGCRVFMFRYTTQDRGQKVEATAVLGIPANTDEVQSKDFPMSLFLHGTTGFADVCAPGREGSGQLEAALLASQGFIAVAPDYIGLNSFGDASTARHAYLGGEQVAIGSWDALRAARQLLADEDFQQEIQANEQVVVWGGSQGGHAALFTELYGPYYAPEMDVAAVVALVPPSDLLSLASIAVSEFGPPSIAFTSVLTTLRAWYGAPENLNNVFVNEDPYFLADNAEQYVFMEGMEECDIGDVFNEDDFSQVSDIFTDDFAGKGAEERWDELEPWSCYFRENGLSTTSVPALRYTPTLMVYSELDDLVVTAPQLDDFDKLCQSGYQLEQINCAGAGHSAGAIWSLPEQVAWVRQRLAGEAMDSAKLCQRTEPVCCLGTPEDECTSKR